MKTSVFWLDNELGPDWGDDSTGWYWQALFLDGLPDGNLIGPFASSMQAHEDANEISKTTPQDRV